MTPRPPASTLFPYTTLFRSDQLLVPPLERTVALPQVDGVPVPVGQHLHLDVPRPLDVDRKSTRLNSSHVEISYAVFCLKKKNTSSTSPRQPSLFYTPHGAFN